MQLYKKISAVFLLGIALLLSACGDTGTNGSIVLTLVSTDLLTGSYSVAAKAVITAGTSSSGTASSTTTPTAGQPITVTYKSTTATNQTGTTGAVELRTDSTGTVTNTFIVQQGTEIINFWVTASAGALKSETMIEIIPARTFSNTTTNKLRAF